MPENVILGATIETETNTFGDTTPSKYHRYRAISKAPLPFERLNAMEQVKKESGLYTFVSIEPILTFHHDAFLAQLKRIEPWVVAVGYDNYDNRLPEPVLEQTESLISALEANPTTVYRKTIQRTWYENTGEP